MKKVVVLLLLVTITIGLSAQSRELSILLSSYRMEITNQKYIDQADYIPARLVNSLYGAGFGYYIPVFTPAPNFGIGINASVNIGKSYHSTSSNEIIVDLGLPVTAAFRYGAGSTREAYSPFGIGIGGGCKLNAALVDGDPFYLEEDPIVLTTLKPFMFVEIVLDYQKRNRNFFDNFKIQFAIQPPITKSGYSNSQEANIISKMTYYNISFIKFNALD
jgi:hypothetical protein